MDDELGEGRMRMLDIDCIALLFPNSSQSTIFLVERPLINAYLINVIPSTPSLKDGGGG